MRVGVLGGTFDPVHIGHVLLAQSVQEQLALDQVLFVPVADPPHREADPPQAAAEDRLAMVERAIAASPCFLVSRIELDRPGKSYTVDTLTAIGAERAGDKLFLIIGADNVSQLSTWHKPEAILELCTIVAGSRVTDSLPLATPLTQQLQLVDTPLIQLSSTLIRERIRAGRSIRYKVPTSVEAYIAERGLYAHQTRK